MSLTPTSVRRMRAVIERCRASGGFLCVSREHRASLLLKQQVLPTSFVARVLVVWASLLSKWHACPTCTVFCYYDLLGPDIHCSDF